MKGRARDRARYDKRRADPRNLAYQRKYQNALRYAKRRSDPEWAREVDRKNAARQRERRATDGKYLALHRLRSRLGNALRLYAKGGKVCRSDEYGVNYQAIIDHLGPCPGERDAWHIDHVVPLSSFDLDDPGQVREAFAPANHQWLTQAENLRKGATVPER